MAEEELGLTLYISNVPINLTETELRDLFGFCGDVQNTDFSAFPLYVSITFKNSSAYRTALLLDKALLKDKTINVSKYPPSDSVQKESPAPPISQNLSSSTPLPPPTTLQTSSLPIFPQTPSIYPMGSYPACPGAPISEPTPTILTSSLPIFPQAPSIYPVGSPGAPIYPPEPPQVSLNSTSIQVTGISPFITDDQLIDFFRFCGEIQGLARQPQGNDALLQFTKTDSVKLAREMGGAEINGTGSKIGVSVSSLHYPQYL